MSLSGKLAAMRLFQAFAWLLALVYVTVWLLVVGAIGYVAYEILFNSALDRWFG